MSHVFCFFTGLTFEIVFKRIQKPRTLSCRATKGIRPDFLSLIRNWISHLIFSGWWDLALQKFGIYACEMIRSLSAFHPVASFFHTSQCLLSKNIMKVNWLAVWANYLPIFQSATPAKEWLIKIWLISPLQWSFFTRSRLALLTTQAHMVTAATNICSPLEGSFLWNFIHLSLYPDLFNIFYGR